MPSIHVVTRLRPLLLAGLCLVVATPGGPVAADSMTLTLDEARVACEDLGGVFDVGGAILEVDLTGDGTADTLIDARGFSCTAVPSPYCGSGGCPLHAFVGDQAWSFQAEGWRMLDWDGRPILLVARDGGWCGGAGAEPCFEAVVWSSGDMFTVMPQVR